MLLWTSQLWGTLLGQSGKSEYGLRIRWLKNVLKLTAEWRLFTEKNQITKHYMLSDLTGAKSKGKDGTEVLMVESSERQRCDNFHFYFV